MNDTTTPTMAIPLSNADGVKLDDDGGAAAAAPAAGKESVQEDAPLFSASLISAEVSSQLPEGYSMRPLRRSDYHGGMVVVFLSEDFLTDPWP